MDGGTRGQGPQHGRSLPTHYVWVVLVFACAPAAASAESWGWFQSESAAPRSVHEVQHASGPQPAANGIVHIGDGPLEAGAASSEPSEEIVSVGGEGARSPAGSPASRRPISPNESRALGRDAGLLGLGDSHTAQAPSSAEMRESVEGAGPVRLLPGAGELTRVGGSLAVVLAAMAMCAILYRRFGGLGVRAARPQGVLHVLARYPLGRGHSLLLLKMDRRLLLLHQGGGSISALSEVTDPREVASLLASIEAGAGERFTHKLQRALQKREREEDNPFRRSVETIDLTRTQGRGLRAAQRLKELGA